MVLESQASWKVVGEINSLESTDRCMQTRFIWKDYKYYTEFCFS